MAVLVPVGIALAAGAVYLMVIVAGSHETASGGEAPSRALSLVQIWPALMFVFYVAGLAATAISLVVAVLVWLPWYFLSLWLGYTSWQAYSLIGCAVSVVVLGLLALPDSPMPPDPLVWQIAVIVAGPSAAIQLWRHARPDQP